MCEVCTCPDILNMRLVSEYFVQQDTTRYQTLLDLSSQVQKGIGSTCTSLPCLRYSDPGTRSQISNWLMNHLRKNFIRFTTAQLRTIVMLFLELSIIMHQETYPFLAVA